MPRSSAATRVALALLITGTAVTLHSAPAHAASIGVASVLHKVKVQYSANNGNVNRLVVTGSGRTVIFDDRVPIKAGPGCKAIKGDRTKVRCTVPQKVAEVAVYLYDGNDTVTNNSDFGMYAQGDNGNDTLIGGHRRDRMNGVAGNDIIYGRGGNNSIDGADGNDRIYGGPDHDFINGGTGADVLYGGAYSDTLWGEAGDDVLYGQEGGEALIGGTGNDKIYGGDGVDNLSGGLGNDLLNGGGGTYDSCTGGKGKNTLLACEFLPK